MVDLDTVDNDPRKGDIGFIGKHRCSCCGYVCPRQYARGFKSNGSLHSKTQKTQIFLAEVDALVAAGLKGPEIAEELEIDLDTLNRRLRYNNYDMSKVKVKHNHSEFSEKFTELHGQGLTMRQIAEKMELNWRYVHDKSLKLGLREPLRRGRK